MNEQSINKCINILIAKEKLSENLQKKGGKYDKKKIQKISKIKNEPQIISRKTIIGD